MIEQFNGLQMDKAYQLASLNKGMKIVGDILEYREEGVNLPVAKDLKDSIYVDWQFYKGMKRCLVGIYFDLVDQGMAEVAQDILKNFK